mgnify:CR=1 FL=1
MVSKERFVRIPGLVAFGAVLLGGCAGQTAKISDAEKAERSVAKAEQAIAETRETTDDWGLWKSTLKILGNAETSLEQGDYQAATEGARQARFEARKGLAQYREEKSEWKTAVKAAKSNGDFPEQEWVSGG